MVKQVMITLDIVVPCYNEQEVLPASAEEISRVLEELILAGLVTSDSCITFVDDGSRDSTWQIIGELVGERPGRFRGIKLSRNKGHQTAVLAGLLSSRADAVVTIDADLQDDPNCIREMVQRHLAGDDIVYGVRSDRKLDTAFKRFSAEGYYRFLKGLGVEVVFNHADYRLMGRRAIDALSQFTEVNLFLRAIVPLIGLKSSEVAYRRTERLAGESKYPLRKMLALAMNGVTSFSMRPLRFITIVGFVTAAVSFAVGVWAFFAYMLGFSTVPGWASIVVPMMFLSGLQLLSLGIIGEYVGKTYIETKRRPLYFIDERIG